MEDFPPNRLQEMAEAILRGERADPRRYAMLLAVDSANIGREFVRSAIEREENENERVRKLLEGTGAGDGG